MTCPDETRAPVRAIRERPETDVLIIGGGINGIATFRELALQGVDVILVDRSDFVSGASAASSHMIHGGVRYLENGEFRLVKESVQERNRLLRLAPHFVRPLRTTIPIFSTFSGLLRAPLRFLRHGGPPRERGALLVRIGLTIYDLFSREGGTLPRHRLVGRRRTLAELPHLDPRVRYAATYFDASVHDPERLALDVLLDGLDAGPHARAASYVEAVGASPDGIVVRDRESGETVAVRARLVVNASGPWSDLTNAALGSPTKFLGGTKGSHIVLDNADLLEATGGREIFFENDDGRIVLIYPVKGKVLVGTTDTDADPRKPARCTEAEVDYFFALVHRIFPRVRLDRDQIVFRYSGIRPLPRHDDLQPGFVSRDYRIERLTVQGVPVLSLVGGKWTTFRALGERLADEALQVLGVARTTDTTDRVIGGGRDWPATREDRAAWLRRELGHLRPSRGEVLFVRYGTRSRSVVHPDQDMDDTELLDGLLSTHELRYLMSVEHAVHVTDVVLRRTDLAFTGRVDAEALDVVGRAMGEIAGWSEERLVTELDEAARYLVDEHGVRLDWRSSTGAR
jgi:glycerol-3-phosphate dehydrogenase